MRSTIAIATAAAFVTSAFAADCNPSYNVAPSTDCFTACNVKNGQKWVPGWTMDHKSDKFLASLALMCNKTGPNYGSFMAASGMCMAGCAGDDPELFNKEFAGACAWYASHKDDKCDAGVTTTKATTTTTTTTKAATTTAAVTTGASTTGAATTGASTTTGAATTGAATTGASTTGAATTTGVVTTTTTVTATATNPAGTVTVTVTDCAAPTNAVCKSGFRGKKNGRGPKDACCSSSDDCQESCVKGLCNSKYDNVQVCIGGAINKRMGDGLTGHCCSHSDDCKESCVAGICGL